MQGDWLASQSGEELIHNNINNGKNNTNNNNHNHNNDIDIPRGGLECLVSGKEGKPKNSKKNPQSKDKNQQQTQPTCDTRSRIRTWATDVVWPQVLTPKSVILTHHLQTIMTTMTRNTPPTITPIIIHFHSFTAGSAVPKVGEKVGSPGLNHASIPDIFAPIAASISLLWMTIIWASILRGSADALLTYWPTGCWT